MDFPNLDALIKPREIVIIGASEREGSHARNTYENITNISNFDKDSVYLVNPKYDKLYGEKCYKNVQEIKSDKIDVAIILVKAELVAEIVEKCDEVGIPFALVMSSGFVETGKKGEVAQEKLIKVMERTKIRIYGPNSPGLTDINRQLGMTFSPAFKYDTLGGNIGLVGQGGGMGRSLLQGMKKGVGFGYFASIGNEIDIDMCDFIFYMLNDPNIKVITVVAEGIKNGDKLIEVAKYALEKQKPIVMLKVGRTELGQRAVMSHTGKLAGSDRVFDAMCQQFGIIRVNDTDELLETSALFSRCGIKSGGKIAIVTSSGGSGSHCADQIGLASLEVANLSETTVTALREITPPFASLANPIDLTATVLEDRSLHTRCLEIIANDENVDIIVTPIASSYGSNTEVRCQDLVEVQNNTDVVIIATWMSTMEEGGYDVLVDGGLVPFRSVRNTVGALKNFINYGKFLSKWSNTSKESGKDFNKYKVDIPDEIGVLNENDSKKIIKSIGISTPKEVLVHSYEEALRVIDNIGYPVVIKCVSRDIPHKTEAGIVKLNINNQLGLKEAFEQIQINVNKYNPNALIEGYLLSEMIENGLEMIVGIKNDPHFGPIVIVGMGGIFTEVFDDVSIGVCPVSQGYAIKMINDLKTAPLLHGFRGSKKRDVQELATTIERLSCLAVAMKDQIKEIDVNPILVLNDGNGVRAVDSLVVTEASLKVEGGAMI